MAAVEVLFIAGYPRSGTTIIGNILNEVEGFVHVGELRYIWRDSIVDPQLRCGCALPLRDCPFWSEVLGVLFPDIGGHDRWPELQRRGREVLADQRRALASRRIPLLLRRAKTGSPTDRYADLLGSLYRAIATVSGASVVVDSSKWPTDAAATGVAPGVRVSYLHLVRDPRGVAHSRQRRVAENGHGRHDWRLLTYDAIGWTSLHIAMRAVTRRWGPDRRVLLRYEDVAADPQLALGEVLALLGRRPSELTIDRDGHVHLHGNHSTAGGRNRRQVGPVPVRVDQRWHQDLTGGDRAIVNALTWPVRRRLYP